MSATLGRLRKLFDDPIFVKQGRDLVATPLAESMVEPVREALSQIQTVLSVREGFDPKTSRRTFSITASDYVTLIFLHPLLKRLAAEAPNVTLQIQPVADDYSGKLWRNETDLLILPTEIMPEPDRFERRVLFTDRYVCAVDGANDAIGDEITLEEFCTQPYMATSLGGMPAFAELQLEGQGIKPDWEITASSTLAPFLLRDTRFIMLILEKLGQYAAREVNLRLLEPPMPLTPITETLFWTGRFTNDPGHLWLRNRLHELVEELGVRD